jgi:hypothetical protein
LLSLSYRFAIALLLLCYRFAIALLSLCHRFAIHLLSIYDRFAVALSSLCCRYEIALQDQKRAGVQRKRKEILKRHQKTPKDTELPTFRKQGVSSVSLLFPLELEPIFGLREIFQHILQFAAR